MASDSTARRRKVIGAVSVAMGLVAMTLLVANQDRIRTRSKESACNGGDVDACLWLSQAYANGTDVAPDTELSRSFRGRALEHLATECGARMAPSCFRWGDLLQSEGSEDGKARAVDAFERGCKGELSKSCLRAAELTAVADKKRSLLELACKAGEDSTCVRTARELSLSGQSQAAIPMLQSACGRLYARACFDASELFLGRPDLAVDLPRSLKYARQAIKPLEMECKGAVGVGASAQGPAAEACGMLGILLDAGRGVARDLGRAQSMRRAACEGGATDYCAPFEDGWVALRAHYDEDDKSVSAARRRCEEGNPAACVLAADHILYKGNEVSGDPDGAKFFFARAAKLYFEGCERNEVDACEKAGDHAKAGLGMERDVAKAIAAYDRAARLMTDNCAREEAESCQRLASMYAKGRIVAFDPEGAKQAFGKAKALMVAACAGPSPSDPTRQACLQLARLLREGIVVPPDKEAVRAMKRCCEASGADAQDSCCKGTAIPPFDG